MGKYKITLDREHVNSTNVYIGEVTINNKEYDYYLTKYSNGDPLEIEFLDDCGIDEELFEYEIEELKSLIRNKYQNEF